MKIYQSYDYIDALAEANQIENLDEIYPGQVLKIPTHGRLMRKMMAKCQVDEKLNAVYTSSMATVHGKTAGGII